MDARLIEKMDRRGYRFLLWITLGFAVWYGMFIAKEMIPEENTSAEVILALSQLPFMILFAVGLFMLNKHRKEMVMNPRLKEAVNNELVRYYGCKSLKWAIGMTFITILVIFLTETLSPGIITVRLTCMLTVYTGALTGLIAQLVYLRK